MKKVLLLVTIGLLLCAGNVLAYNMMTAEVLKAQMEAEQAMVLIDIQVADEFDQHHLTGAVATYAFPVKSDADRAKLDAVLAELKTSDALGVVICPRGKGGAKRTYDYLKKGGIAEERLCILKNGQQGWPFDELVVSH